MFAEFKTKSACQRANEIIESFASSSIVWENKKNKTPSKRAQNEVYGIKQKGILIVISCVPKQTLFANFYFL